MLVHIILGLKKDYFFELKFIHFYKIILFSNRSVAHTSIWGK
ncbi:hypothetical protein HNQ03_002491 [Chryseobacterium sp. 16F]|uniref:Uncharacterized protein n=1 Tax=Frigoriflavimonas asaccharolytica TaxID=2735899 RepID=A0A8J8GBB9_9FLAO|nr:hypothetical protein [Frigoriflavimonas asaccharolytica]